MIASIEAIIGYDGGYVKYKIAKHIPSLIPLVLDHIENVSIMTTQIRVRGKAILFEIAAIRRI